MKVSFYTVSYSPIGFKSRNTVENNSDIPNKQRRTFFDNLGLSLGVGVTMGGLAAGVMRYKKIPNAFVNSLDFGSVFSYLAYMGTIIATPFRVK